MPVAIAFTAWVLHHQFNAITLRALRAAVDAQPAHQLMQALALTALSFTALAVYDWMGVDTVAPQRVPATAALLAGATASAISHTLGFHAVTGSLVRLRIYQRHGLTKADVLRVTSLSWLAPGLGLLAMLAVAAWVDFFKAVASWRPALVGLAISSGLAMFLAWLRGGTRRLRFGRFSQPLPSARSALLQMVMGLMENVAAIAALFVLLPADLAPPFAVFAVACIGANAMGVVTHVPGGIGIFEAGITVMLAGAGRADLLAALLAYRVTYNLIPFMLSLAALAGLGYLGRGRLSSTAGTGG